MAQNYTRQSSFADGDTITAALFNNEFNQVVNAFSYSASSDSSTGHKHDGTAGQGGNIPQIGDIDFLNKIVVDNTNNRWGFYVQVSSGTVEQLRIQDGAIVPVTNNDIDLGTSSLEFKDLFIDGTAHIDTLDVDVNATVAGTLGVTGATTLSSTLGVTGATTLSSTLGVTGATTLSSTLGVTGAITGSSTLQATTITATTAFVPDASDGASLGTTSLEFSDLFLADGALIAFGNDQDVTITHLADAGLLLNGARGLFFNDTTQYINAPNGTTLDIAATDEIELNATLIDINGAVDISGNLDVGGNLVVTGTTTFNGGTLTMGDAATDNVVFGADINSNIIPNTDDTYDLGSSSQEWRNLYIDGTANIDSLVADTADINGGTIDGATIATSDITVGSGKTLNVSAGTLTLADDQISGDKVEGGTIAATTITTLTSTTGNITSVNATTVDTTNLEVTTLKAKDGTAAGSIADSTGVVTLASSVLTTTDINGGTIDGATIGGSSAGDITYANLSDGTITITAFADEDDMSSDSATLVPTQQSVKAYVDAQVTAQDLDIVGDTGTDAIDLDSETITFAGGTGITSVVTAGTVTHNIDSTVATLTGSQTLTNKSLTAPTLTGTAIVASLDISGDIDVDGTTNLDVVDIDGAVDMASTLAVGGVVTANAGIVVDNFTLDGTTLALSSGDFTVDVAGDIILDADTGVWRFKDAGTTLYQIAVDGASVVLYTGVSDADMVFKGNDGGSTVTALTLDMSAAGAATFNAGATFGSGIDVTGTVTADGLTVDTDTLVVDATNNRVGIGTDSPSSILSTSGTDTTVYSSSSVGGQDSSATLKIQNLTTAANSFASIDFNTNNNRVVNRIVSGHASSTTDGFLAFVTEGGGTPAERMRIDASGLVGIGTSPDTTLHLQTPSGTKCEINFAQTAVTNYRIGVPASTDALVFTYGGSTERMRLDENGNLGIGVSPSTKLHVLGGRSTFYSGDNYAVGVGNASGVLGGYMGSPAVNVLSFSEPGGVERMRIDASGNALVGRTASLTAQSESISSDTVMSVHGVLSQHQSDCGVMQYTADAFQLRAYGATAGTGNIQFLVGGGGGGADSEAMRINSSGNLLVGCTAVPSTSIEGFCATGTSSGNLSSSGASTSAYNHWLFVNGNGAVGSISTSSSATTYSTSSDQRLKENIADADDAGSKVDAIQVRKFDWKADGSHQDYGMVAQELQLVAPEAVSGDADSEEMMGVDYSKLVPMMLKEIQSLRARVAQLES